MLKLTKLSSVIALVTIAGTAFAQDVDANIDVNGDGFYSFPEVSTIYPDVTADVFTQLDTTGDGLLDMAEVAAAQDAGLMPVME
ncbi:hypothetical protein Q4555_12505 [Octadecabacter sp. 1_MG-2023]|uniref:hypothetical protein n=1 Tax=unclassified Octadecabacter TaxID=196158 RepID=UPI001C086504|nr:MULTISPECIES: hypothetical protein [unclassified Octadecabacter]MBU2993663.1 hypothetical protein [Octadecabacter sp. B2R22]MDO6735493.1 hypothetical protein [Octadecabacter sp. 1_MG-2023]